MHAVERFVTAAHPEAIWRILADVERWPSWTPSVLEVKPLRSSELRVGTLYRVSQPKLPPAVYEVTECIPNKAFTWVRRVPGGSMIADHRLVPRNGCTEVELSFASKGFLADVLGSIFSRQIREFVAIEARSLQRECESL